MVQSNLLKILILSASMSLVACGQSVRHVVTKSVETNQASESLLAWEQSEYNPDNLFENWRQDLNRGAQQMELSAEICGELASLDQQSLSIFEEELRRPENNKLVANCKDTLFAKLEHYYTTQRANLNISLSNLEQGNNFKFPPNVQKRDVSNGYYAVSGDVAKKEVILTFDDGPSGIYTESILKSLAAVDAKAIFFAMGRNVRANPAILKKVAADGHAIGSHSISHACLGTSWACRKTNGHVLSFEQAVAEIKGGHQAVYDTLGWVDPFFRFPYGETSSELKNFLKGNSTGEFFWSIDSNDWKAQTNANLLATTMKSLNERGRGILLFHDIQRKTAEIMPQLLQELYKGGYSIVLLQAADPNARYNSKLVKKPLP